jgi:hypothetical protein
VKNRRIAGYVTGVKIGIAGVPQVFIGGAFRSLELWLDHRPVRHRLSVDGWFEQPSGEVLGVGVDAPVLVHACDDGKEMERWDHGGGFSLDATVRIAANDRRGLERLLRYCARPAWP